MRLYREFQAADALGLVMLVVVGAVLFPGDMVWSMAMAAVGGYALGHQTGTKKPQRPVPVFTRIERPEDRS